MPGVVHVLDPYHGMARGSDSAAESLAMLEEIIELEGPQTIAAFFLETVTGTNGVLIPPDGYLEGVRDLCTKHGILMVCDEVMAGFGRTGEWFAVNHWKVVPDIITMAKGLTSAYVALGAVGVRQRIADHFRDKVFQSGLTYNSHPLGCAAALATLRVYEEDDLIGNARRLGPLMAKLLDELAWKHPMVGAHRSIGLFGTRRAGQESRDARAAGAVRSETAATKRLTSACCARKASTPSCAGTRFLRTLRCVSPRNSSGRIWDDRSGADAAGGRNKRGLRAVAALNPRRARSIGRYFFSFIGTVQRYTDV